MGGNSVSGPSRRVSTPTTSPKQKALDKVLEEMKELSPSERKSAVASLKKAGLSELAKALEKLVPSGSRPAERPQTTSSGKSGGKR